MARTKATVPIQSRVLPETARKIKLAAQAQHRSVSALLHILILEYLKIKR